MTYLMKAGGVCRMVSIVSVRRMRCRWQVVILALSRRLWRQRHTTDHCQQKSKTPHYRRVHVTVEQLTAFWVLAVKSDWILIEICFKHPHLYPFFQQLVFYMVMMLSCKIRVLQQLAEKIYSWLLVTGKSCRICGIASLSRDVMFTLSQ